MIIFTHIVIGSDHAGFQLKKLLTARLEELSVSMSDMGTFSTESCDYPLIAKKTCETVLADEGRCGILVCGTGIGMSMAANRFPLIRAAVCANEFQARACRRHNDANVLCLGERVTGLGVALDILEIFLSTPFEGGRHQRRVEFIER